MRALVLAGSLAAALLLLVAAGCGGSDEPSADGSTAAAFDQAFVDAMVMHHEQAIAMSKDALAAGLAEPVLVDIANSIVEAQQTEIDQLKSWRAEWFGSSVVDPNGGDALGLSDDEMGMGPAMDFATAKDVDAAFATAMIAHHEGAITMAELVADRTDRPELETLAADIIEAQTAEVEQMKPFASDDAMEGMNHG